MPKVTNGPLPTPWDETGLENVDVSGMGGELTPFYPAVDAIGRAMLVHDIIQHVDTEYGARMFVHVSFVFPSDDEKDRRFTLSFTEKAPAHAQLSSLADAGEGVYPIGPVTLVRQGKSYRVASGGECKK